MAEKIIVNNVSDQFKDDYTRFALYTTYKRVLADIRDGFKPVQRRILYAMFKNSGAVTHHVKSSAVIGDVMKYYHGHGNCLHTSAHVLLSNGELTTIGELYKRNFVDGKFINYKAEIFAIDTTRSVITTGTISNIRIGQYTNKIYHIKFCTGYEIKCTENHPFLTYNNEWIQAKNIVPGTVLEGSTVELFADVVYKQNRLIYPVKDVYIEDVDNEPMYDFTVEGLENMLIPIDAVVNHSIGSVKYDLICAHNSGIYAGIKPMVNWWESKVPLIDKQGNFGNLSGDIASAERYTEIRLSKFALECVIGELADTTKATDWIPNYSNTTVEPEFLPVKVPILLIEGSIGIGVGLKADIPAHNLNEVIDATLYLMHNPDGQVALIPDHCMECEIFDTDWEQISKTGFGHYTIRGKVDIEDYGNNRKAVVIKSLPDLTFLDTVKDKIEELVEKKKLIQIDHIYDQCTQGKVDSMRLVLVLKPGADPNFVREVVYKNTKVQQTCRINTECLYGMNPLRVSYKSYLMSFLDFRRQTKYRVAVNMLQNLQTRLHEKDAYIKVLESGQVDEIIAMIRKRKDTNDEDLIEALIKKIKITDLQAKFIINANIKSLSIGYLNKYKQEAINLQEQINWYTELSMNPVMIDQEIEKELLDIKARYGKPRTCRVIRKVDDIDIPKGIMQVAVSEKNYIRKIPDGARMGVFKNDSVRTIIKIDNTDSIIIFDDKGKVFKLPVHKIPFTDSGSNGTDIRFLIKGLTANINCIIPESVFIQMSKKGSRDNKHYLITITRNGLYKRMDLDDFITVPPSGIIYAKLDPDDTVKDIIIAHSNFNVIVYSDRKATSVRVNDIPYLKRNTKGSKSVYNADTVDGLCVIDQTKSDIVVVTETGRVNRIPIVSLPISAPKKGFNVVKLSSTDKINTIVAGNESNVVCIKTLKNYYEIPVMQLQIGSSISTGEKLIPMKADQMIRCWIK